MAIYDQPNNFSPSKPVVILYVDQNENLEALETDENQEKMVFANLSKAQKYAQRRIIESEHKNLRFANENPVMGAGDAEETHHRKCLRCGGGLRLGEQTMHRLPGMGDLASVEYLCPKCDIKK